MLAAVPMSVAELRRAVGRFETDTAGMVLASIRTAERAFAELDACDTVIDEAGARGEKAAARLRELLALEAADDVGAELDALEATASEVRRSMAVLQLMNRILGRDADDEGAPQAVVRLAEDDLPPLPSSYDDGEYDDLMAMADREAELAPRLEHAHRQRVSRVAAHLVNVVQGVARTGFADERFARDALHEARRCYELWRRCLAERRRDLGR
ncbi:hypothetical protein [Streptomyces chattanoogensis]|uniref:hypothetical protein n=1 Tax=Streptomyces chattanoogensis TaxID=66876 RepID=UPI0012FEFD05|nr:hypothetical protein [Streptomyces chattanoogensis]